MPPESATTGVNHITKTARRTLSRRHSRQSFPKLAIFGEEKVIITALHSINKQEENTTLGGITMKHIKIAVALMVAILIAKIVANGCIIGGNALSLESVTHLPRLHQAAEDRRYCRNCNNVDYHVIPAKAGAVLLIKKRNMAGRPCIGRHKAFSYRNCIHPCALAWYNNGRIWRDS